MTVNHEVSLGLDDIDQEVTGNVLHRRGAVTHWEDSQDLDTAHLSVPNLGITSCFLLGNVWFSFEKSF